MQQLGEKIGEALNYPHPLNDRTLNASEPPPKKAFDRTANLDRYSKRLGTHNPLELGKANRPLLYPAMVWLHHGQWCAEVNAEVKVQAV